MLEVNTRKEPVLRAPRHRRVEYLQWLASPAKNKACPRRVTLRIGQNGAEELTPPGQAILVRGTETLTVMTPYLPDDERAQRLNALRRARSS